MQLLLNIKSKDIFTLEMFNPGCLGGKRPVMKVSGDDIHGGFTLL